MATRNWLTSTFFAILISLSVLHWALEGFILPMWWQVRQYAGDGKIEKVYVPFSGYRIVFEQFDSSKSYDKTYRLIRVPQRGSERAVVYLRFLDYGRFLSLYQARPSNANFSISISDCSGNLLHTGNIPLATSAWSGGLNKEGGTVGVYELKESEFLFRRNRCYYLNISYSPGSRPPPAREVFVTIENGGHI
jgi:hypothetical protein